MSNMESGKKEKSILEIIHIIYRKKLILIFSVVITLILGYIYSQSTSPVYESTALLKKEMEDRKQVSNDFYDIVKLQTQDEVETEMELVKTSEVLGSVVNDLKLYLIMNKIVTADGTNIELQNVFVDFPDSGNVYKYTFGHKLPKFFDIKIFNPEARSRSLFIIKTQGDKFELRDAKDGTLILKSKPILPQNSVDSIGLNNDKMYPLNDNIGSQVRFKTNPYEFSFSWDGAPVGSRIYFSLMDYYSAIKGLSGQIGVSKVGKTNVFQISVTSASPVAAMIIAERLIDKFRELRIDQQKQTIRYSFKFVDQQLDEIREKLRDAENNLSNFKSSGQIISIDETSKELISYLSTLEAEKLKTDLQLTDYKNKLTDLKNELASSGYFDQSGLDLKGGSDFNSPFSNLLKQITDLELQKLELLQKRSENHPDVKNIEEQIRMSKEKLGSYNQNTIASYQILINSMEKKLLKISSLMSKYESRIQKLPGQENELARLLRQKDVYEKIFTLLLDKREEMRIAEVSKLQDIVVVDPPQKPLNPIKPNKRLNMLIALVAGGFIGLIGIFIVELKNTRFINVDELEEDFQLPVISIVPKYSREILNRIKNAQENHDKFVGMSDNNLGIKESLRLLKTKIDLQLLDSNDKIILITSCEENTGKTTLVSNLAITLAQENKKVLIIDCDLKKAELSQLFNLPIDTPGLIDYLTKDSPPSIYTKVMKKIDIIPAGGLTDDSAALLGSEKMKLMLDTLNSSSEYEYVLIDTPPVTRVVDTLVLGRMVKNAILVVRPEVSLKETVESGIQELKQVKIKVRGVVANAVQLNKSYTYRYKYGYGYGYSAAQKEKTTNNLKNKFVRMKSYTKSKSTTHV
jgi:capsular exopolysaccharide synthesis family protein